MGHWLSENYTYISLHKLRFSCFAFFFFLNFILFMAVLGLCFCARAFSSCGRGRVVVRAECGSGRQKERRNKGNGRLSPIHLKRCLSSFSEVC